MSRIKIFKSNGAKKLQKKVDKWTAKMTKKHPAVFKISGTSLGAYDDMGPEIFLTVTYKT